MNQGETTGRSSRPRSTPEYLHKWKPKFQTGGNKATLRQQGSQAETWGTGKRKPYNFQFHASLRVKTVTTGGTEKWPKKGGGTTGMTVARKRHRHQPKTSHHPQENSQARFLQLDKTKNEENQSVQSQSVLRSAPRENLQKPSGNSPKVKSRIGHD